MFKFLEWSGSDTVRPYKLRVMYVVASCQDSQACRKVKLGISPRSQALDGVLPF